MVKTTRKNEGMTIGYLRQMQGLPLEAKIIKSQQRIKEWHEYWEGNVYVSFSGGKDSTVLLRLVRDLYPNVPALFIDTGLEFPEVKRFVKKIDNVIWKKPDMSFRKVIENYGYPVISKQQSQYIHELRNTKSEKVKNIRRHGNKWGMGKVSKKWRFMIDAPFKISNKCCDKLKKQPYEKFEKESKLNPFIGTMASDSYHREQLYLQSGGCNSFESKRGASKPLGFWLESDIWKYLKEYNVEYSDVYDKLKVKGTGCMFCIFGVHLEGQPNRFQKMAKTHPKHYKYCMDKLKMREVLEFMRIPYKPIDEYEQIEIEVIK